MNGYKILSISNLPAFRVTQVLIPIEKVNDEQDIEFLNLREKGIGTKSIIATSTPGKIAFEEAIKLSLIYTFLFLIFNGLSAWYYHIRCETIENKFNETNKKITDIKLEYEAYSKSCSKCRVLLLAKLSDYAKENDFWKDTVRKLLYENKTKNTPEQLFDVVTHSLKTYATKCKNKDYDTIKCMANMINNQTIKKEDS